MKFNPPFLEFLLCLWISLALVTWVKYGKQIGRWWKALHSRSRRPRQLIPREPTDCPQCAAGIHWLPGRPRRGIAPWSQVKSPRGRKKQVDTNGYACLNLRCDYFGIADANIHALVSNGLCWQGT